ncbi:MAG TPA: diguanylate cyclase [Thermodesulfobacteriota bacterium]|nr:diguanylate cyclase [Thermodesulfobacteriota bacterium]
MNIRILHIEDNEVVQMALKRKVEADGLPYDIDVAPTLAEASELLGKKSYDIVLIDYMLPDGTGLDLLPKIKGVPAIFVTGSGDAKVAVKALKSGAYDYLIKDPGYMELLPATIEKVMHTFYLEQEHKKNAEQLAAMNAELSRMYEETKALSLQDPLTGLANRRMMNIELERSIEGVKRSGSPLSILMMDIDYFKKYNDTHGHPAGDSLLAAIAKVLTEEVRGADLVARYGGEEFFVLLPDTDLNGACNAAERIRKAVSMSLGVTVSIGAAAYRKEEKMDELIYRADAALYRAKEGGRNRVEAGL